MIYYKIPRGRLVFGSAGQYVVYYVAATDDRHYHACINGDWVVIESDDAFSYWKGGNLQRVSKLEILVMCGKLCKEKEKEVA